MLIDQGIGIVVTDIQTARDRFDPPMQHDKAIRVGSNLVQLLVTASKHTMVLDPPVEEGGCCVL